MKRIFTFLIFLFATQTNAQVEISGIAKNYSDTIFYIREAGGFDNFTRAWRDKMIKVQIEKDGHFKTIIPEKTINTWYIKTAGGNQFFDLIKGKDIILTADFSQSSPLKAIGDNATDFNFLSSSYVKDSINKYYDDRQFVSKIRDKNIDSALFYRKAFANYQLELLKKYTTSRKVSKTYFNWLDSKYTYQPYERAIVENIENRDSINENILQKIIEKGINDDYAALNNSDYNDIIDFYIRSRFMKINSGAFSINDYFDFAAKSNLIQGNTRDVFLSRIMYGMRTAPDSLYTLIFKKYNRIVSNKKIKQLIAETRADYSNSANPAKADFSRSKSIEEILNKYKGKVIYVDFWASWCVPCRAEMPNAETLKNRLKGKDVVFLYLGYNDKEKAWIKARNQLNIEGEHYLLTENMVKEADEVFGINGIPHYVIIDKKGAIVSKRANRPNEVYQQLLTIIDK